MNIDKLLQESRAIWGNEPMTLDHIAIAMGVVYGDICRIARKQKERAALDTSELQKELGNIIFSTIRWCDDLGYDPAACIALAKEAQAAYVKRLTNK